MLEEIGSTKILTRHFQVTNPSLPSIVEYLDRSLRLLGYKQNPNILTMLLPHLPQKENHQNRFHVTNKKIKSTS